MKQPVQRRLAAILAADVAGYSRLIGADEASLFAGRLRPDGRDARQPAQGRGGVPHWRRGRVGRAGWMHVLRGGAPRLPQPI